MLRRHRYLGLASGARVVEDVKRPATAKNREFVLKRRLVEALHGDRGEDPVTVHGFPRGDSSMKNGLILALVEQGMGFAAIGRHLGRSAFETGVQLARIRKHGVAACSNRGGNRRR